MSARFWNTTSTCSSVKLRGVLRIGRGHLNRFDSPISTPRKTKRPPSARFYPVLVHRAASRAGMGQLSVSWPVIPKNAVFSIDSTDTSPSNRYTRDAPCMPSRTAHIRLQRRDPRMQNPKHLSCWISKHNAANPSGGHRGWCPVSGPVKGGQRRTAAGSGTPG
jgi:hypothetical protein